MMSSTISPLTLLITLALLLVVAIVFTVAMIRSRRRLFFAIACVVVVLLGYILVTGGIYLYVDRAAAGVHRGASRAEVRASLRHFVETRVPITDVPRYLRGNIPRSDWPRIYRYHFLSREICVHVAYDSRWRVDMRVDTYE